MEDQLSPLAVTHLLQHTLRSLCIHENSQWVYAVFWRILPRNYPPPKWDGQGGAYDRSRGSRRNWILVWEDGFCNFAASSTAAETNPGDCPSGSSGYGNCEFQPLQGLQPELFFKMSHEIYNYGEGLIGKVAADHSHKWVYKEPNEQEINFLSAWHNSADSHPRTWEAQFQSGIKTIALIAVREGVVQLGSVHKVVEDLSYVVLLRKKFSYIESIPGVLLPHPSSAAFPYKVDGVSGGYGMSPEEAWHYQLGPLASSPPLEFYDHPNFNTPTPPLMMKVTPSMSSLEALLSKLPSVVPAAPPQPAAEPGYYEPSQAMQFLPCDDQRPVGAEQVAAQEEGNNMNQCECVEDGEKEVGESSSCVSWQGRRRRHC
ncbi:protein RICE SALT SENSITIVE 3-like [Malania oleifera]|uniref:protein RICE SALT SENSITIVE 3-like n=1 Tax=Malania oleifera TaxID=397392 RepID=UPI0025ADF5DF|nr:protein RICE SALT SENSITIVE 3-like [Malania oleifera]